ncbi:acyl carrier protein [Catenulispora sp. GP43]|uniref:phosphopantetheine-binding protein n=1 Tax=Catenulispora sp. GP43 TaxID=3156263 RepID=UPI0035138BEC
MAVDCDLAREIVREYLDHPALLDQITDEEDLVNAGVNSGEIIRVALGCENHLDRPLTDVELSRITSVRSVAELLAQAPDSGPPSETGA